jgi:endonuclease/exonuclease/phosphatase family metal-dependent hydrolase
MSQLSSTLRDDPGSLEAAADARWLEISHVIEKLSTAEDFTEVSAYLTQAVRSLVGADGVTLVLREGELCHYVEEDAVGPLWKGQRFPMTACVSGWSMMNATTAVVPDVYFDPRIPVEAYEPTFVRSLVMTPVNPDKAYAAIGTYWSDNHIASANELLDLESLAAVIAEIDPHVLALQEVRAGQAVRLATLLDFPERRWAMKHHLTWPLGSRWAEGLALLSRFPVRAERTTVLTPTSSIRTFRRRVLQEVTLTTAGGPIRVANTHLSSDDGAERSAQAARVVESLASPLDGVGLSRTVLLGDLNTDGDADVVGRLEDAGLRDGSSGPTNPAGAVSQRLDHVLAGSAFALGPLAVPEDGASWTRRSDHLPVSGDLVLAPAVS